MLPLPRKEKELNFDELYRIGSENDCIEYGCVVGSNRIVYIKVGMSGSYIGYEEKYLKMACRLNDNYGCSVICVSNPLPTEDRLLWIRSLSEILLSAIIS